MIVAQFVGYQFEGDSSSVCRILVCGDGNKVVGYQSGVTVIQFVRLGYNSEGDSNKVCRSRI